MVPPLRLNVDPSLLYAPGPGITIEGGSVTKRTACVNLQAFKSFLLSDRLYCPGAGRTDFYSSYFDSFKYFLLR